MALEGVDATYAQNLSYIFLAAGALLLLLSIGMGARSVFKALRQRPTTIFEVETEARAQEQSATRQKSLPVTAWGMDDAIAITIAAFLGGQLLGLALVGGYVSITQGVGFIQTFALVEQEVGLLFASYLIAQLFTIALVAAFLIRRRSTLLDVGLRRFDVGRAIGFIVLFLIGYLIVSGVAVVLLEAINTEIDFQAQQDIAFLEASGVGEMALAFLALVVLAPFAEELVFRGVLLPAVAKNFGIVAAVIITSVIFGLLHPPVNAMIGIGIFALFLALIYIYTDSLWPAILLHSVKNLIAFIAIFFLDDLIEISAILFSLQ